MDEGHNQIAPSFNIDLSTTLISLTGYLCCEHIGDQRIGGATNWLLPVVALSKRLHSIYVIRLFKGHWAVFFVLSSFISQAVVLCSNSAIQVYQHNCFFRSFSRSGAASLHDLSVKMSVLVYLLWIGYSSFW
ncbi:uncharacterized protein EI90DRAFT_329623 [Cantharellus anzutake]|uniref:uncharacterized protein n=1 Tax=Cantharellus anzutake TaxID=1750568 RepID=UPI0019050CF0|nr:uncharacterized protein EI90DRAFT_329623 [Cantharellus anzutake]KAF8335430.1 hypothetical protein EI90DRAFT_329623 [Cantharellus anzutake]